MIVTFWKLESCKIGYAEYRIREDLLKNDELSENFCNQADKSENFPLGVSTAAWNPEYEGNKIYFERSFVRFCIYWLVPYLLGSLPLYDTSKNKYLYK